MSSVNIQIPHGQHVLSANLQKVEIKDAFYQTSSEKIQDVADAFIFGDHTILEVAEPDQDGGSRLYAYRIDDIQLDRLKKKLDSTQEQVLKILGTHLLPETSEARKYLDIPPAAFVTTDTGIFSVIQEEDEDHIYDGDVCDTYRVHGLLFKKEEGKHVRETRVVKAVNDPYNTGDIEEEFAPLKYLHDKCGAHIRGIQPLPEAVGPLVPDLVETDNSYRLSHGYMTIEADGDLSTISAQMLREHGNDWAWDLLFGLEILHKERIDYTDIKMNNVLHLGKKAWFIDFELTKSMPAEDDIEGIRKYTNQIHGFPVTFYHIPLEEYRVIVEQVEEIRNIEDTKLLQQEYKSYLESLQKLQIYATGSLLYNLFAKSCPCKGKYQTYENKRQWVQDFTQPTASLQALVDAGCEPGLADIIMGMIAIDPKDRRMPTL